MSKKKSILIPLLNSSFEEDFLKATYCERRSFLKFSETFFVLIENDMYVLDSILFGCGSYIDFVFKSSNKGRRVITIQCRSWVSEKGSDDFIQSTKVLVTKEWIKNNPEKKTGFLDFPQSIKSRP